MTALGLGEEYVTVTGQLSETAASTNLALDAQCSFTRKGAQPTSGERPFFPEKASVIAVNSNSRLRVEATIKYSADGFQERWQQRFGHLVWR
ncbi:hypothetical protein B5P45_01425 [Phyllobacterium zundukense]|uniref:Uncharacterized protein n=1 Tax=Phyllobacterium zundukense TaxID=1867719 RepID=A0A2N9W423_9HYPH|nr:hypothetical protein BLM14_10645 [Phyllobacterium zundukense]PIO46491.1 hypothetical protein B5P45_01425 [Phyllobacterium zundukense]